MAPRATALRSWRVGMTCSKTTSKKELHGFECTALMLTAITFIIEIVFWNLFQVCFCVSLTASHAQLAASRAQLAASRAQSAASRAYSPASHNQVAASLLELAA
jgi:hypothetical protein